MVSHVDNLQEEELKQASLVVCSIAWSQVELDGNEICPQKSFFSIDGGVRQGLVCIKCWS